MFDRGGGRMRKARRKKQRPARLRKIGIMKPSRAPLVLAKLLRCRCVIGKRRPPPITLPSIEFGKTS